MKVILKLSLLVIYVGLAAAEAAVDHDDEFNLMRFMMASRSLQRDNPQRSLACFDYYIPILNQHSAAFEKNYKACGDDAARSKSQVDSTTKSARDQIEGSARNACSLLSECVDNEDSVKYFGCFVDVGEENSKLMYTISNNASDVLVDIREKYRLIEQKQSICQTYADRVYKKDSAATYEELRICLEGNSPVPTTSSPSSTTGSTSTSTSTASTTTTTPASSTTTTARSTTSSSTTSAPQTTTTRPASTTTTRRPAPTTTTRRTTTSVPTTPPSVPTAPHPSSTTASSTVAPSSTSSSSTTSPPNTTRPPTSASTTPPSVPTAPHPSSTTASSTVAPSSTSSSSTSSPPDTTVIVVTSTIVVPDTTPSTGSTTTTPRSTTTTTLPTKPWFPF